MAELIFSNLNSEIKLDILQILSGEPSSVKEVMNYLIIKSYDVKFRESIYRYPEKFTEINLVEKYYDVENKVIKYRIKKDKMVYNFKDKELSFY